MKSRRSNIRRVVLFFGGAVFLLLAGIAAAWFAAPRFLEDPMAELRRHTPARLFRDSGGSLIHAERTYDYQWRVECTLKDLPEHVIQTMLAAEDYDFYRHSGINYTSMLRAAFQNLTSGRIISGASTITMQLAGMIQPPRTGRRNLTDKFRQMLQARRLEQLYSKEEILQEYFNRLPFGGKIYGIETASLYYFGRKASELNPAETAMLCGLPQKPNYFRPDRYLKQARIRQERVLNLLVHHKILPKQEAERLFLEEPLRLRDFRQPSLFQRLARSPFQLYCEMAAQEHPLDFDIVTALNPEFTTMIRNALEKQIARSAGVRDAAAVLIENRTGKVRVMIGTLDFDSAASGQVNAALARRSAGSALKPFLYAEAVHAGLLTADTILEDSPVRYGAYTPGNYDGVCEGRVKASDALSRSLNTPVIRLLAELGVERAELLFRKLGIESKASSDPGLSMALGTGGTSLYALTRAYTVFANGGTLRQTTFRNDIMEERCPIFAPGVAELTEEMLKTIPMPNAAIDRIAWKTGTSNGNHDAWCFALTDEYTLGVWFGNKNGVPSPELAGLSIAAPAAGEIMSALHRTRKPRELPPEQKHLTRIRLCAESGLAPAPDCKHWIQGLSVRGLPLKRCQICGGRRSGPGLLSPLPGVYRTDSNGQLRLSAAAKETAQWYLNGNYLGEFQKRTLTLPPGSYTLDAVGALQSERVRFSVSREPAETPRAKSRQAQRLSAGHAFL